MTNKFFKNKFFWLVLTFLIFILSENIANAGSKRSQKAINEFKQQNPCPANGNKKGKCPGYVIDHVQPLKRGGSDRPNNMQWQTKEDAKAKDRWE